MLTTTLFLQYGEYFFKKNYNELPRSKLRGSTYGIRSIDSQQAAGN